MLVNQGKKIIMDVGDYGLPLVMKITNNNGQIVDTDTILFKIKSNEKNILEQNYSLQKDENDKLFFAFVLTKEESAKLTKNSYIYEIEAYRESEYLNTLINDEIFQVK